MKAQAKKMAIPAIVAGLMASLAPVPANAIGYSDIALSPVNTNTTLQALPGSVVYLPIGDATAYLHEMTARLHFYLKNIRSEWEEKQIPIAMEKQSPLVQKHLVRELGKRIVIAKKFVDAVRLALANICNDDDLRQEVVSFGRAAASLRYTAEDFLSFIEQTHPPKKTSSELINASDDGVKALIRAEHEALGLEAPAFDRAS
ncbi:hypothetical protein HZI30_05055 [Serratia fonticola]|uniref:hypothetical protein n=1 Tax=Serratia fonticola TaxID=47917 RepID=UPI0015C5D6D2|nr:hypothetical protein [Serratia fonticola]NXZ86302.1 hypothetical protein [Serratia fonticola]